jgi:fumarate reductase (CoM/CoB) subunit B
MKEEQKKTVKVKVRRFNPAEDREAKYETFEVPIETGWNVTSVLRYINENFDGSLSHYISCRSGLCTDCMVRVNGDPRLACMEIVTGDITLDPVSTDRVVRDLVCFHKK